NARLRYGGSVGPTTENDTRPEEPDELSHTRLEEARRRGADHREPARSPECEEPRQRRRDRGPEGPRDARSAFRGHGPAFGLTRTQEKTTTWEHWTARWRS